MSDLKDFKNKNTEFTGTKGIDLPEGTEAQRVDEQGILRFNTDTNLAEYYDGTQWKPIDSPPTIASVSPTSWTSDGSTLQTFTITGSNFQSGATAKFVGNDGTDYTSVNLNIVSSSSFTIQNMTTMGVANEPYDIVITNPSSLTATLEDAVDAGSSPSFSTAADTVVYTGYENDSAPLSETTMVATDADGQVVTHTISAGSLPPGLSLGTNGVLTGTISGSSIQTYTFTVSATDGFNTVTRQFKITIIANPYISATGGTVTTSGDYKIHTFTGDGTLEVSSVGTPSGSTQVTWLVVAGGGGGGVCNTGISGGGGGAGGFRESPSSVGGSYTTSPLAGGSAYTFPASGSYPITVGAGGAGVTAPPCGIGDTPGSQGSNSVALGITSTGGGGGGGNGIAAFKPGGSGGGGEESDGSGGSGNSPPVSPSQGNPGGNGSEAGNYAGAGGGAGGAGNPGSAGNGGAEVTTHISGSPVGYSGGGGGGQGQGGGGSGGAGGREPQNFPGTPRFAAQNGAANRGGGGGAAPGCQADGPATGSGGKGVVIIRYKYQN